MFIQRILAWFDDIVSEIFWLTSFGDGDESGTHRWMYFVDLGPTVGIVGVDGKIHTMTGFWSVNHYYDGKKLLRRVPARKDLKAGERLATSDELSAHKAEIRRLLPYPGGLCKE